ncbi:hypothetical protein IKQ26_07890 [bacterium]|nr:hypothetical protein [bacterium]
MLGIGGGINFKSGDISGTAAKTSDDRASQGTEYFLMGEEEQRKNEEFVDRSMQLRASLNSLALMNVASVLNKKLQTKLILPDNPENKQDKKVEPIEDKKDGEQKEQEQGNSEKEENE